MLVKELRQGMRARTFTSVFLGMQLLLGMLLLGALIASDSERTGSIVSGIILTFYVITVVFIQPLRGINALSGEMRDHTIDLMTITRLTAWRIVLGKWVAIVSQSALLLVTIIPYLLLRYFFGGMNLLGEITAFVCLFAGSMALTAFTVGLSACRLAMARILFPVALLLLLFISSFGISMMIYGVGSSGVFSSTASTGDAAIGVTLLLATFAYLGHQALSMGASLIAPAAENHAITRRIITLLAVVVLVLTGLFYQRAMEPVWMLGLPLIAIPALVIALTESSHVAPGLVARFKKRGLLGVVMAVFLIPGAASGFFFSLLLSGVVAAGILVLQWAGGAYWDQYPVRMLGLWGTLLFPAVLLSFLQRGEGQKIGPYLLLLLATLLLWVILQSFAQVAGDQTMLLFVWCPVVFAFGDLDAFDSTQGMLMVFAVMFLFNALLAVRSFREMRGLLSQATPPPSQET